MLPRCAKWLPWTAGVCLLGGAAGAVGGQALPPPDAPRAPAGPAEGRPAERLRVPPELPGAEVPPIELPPLSEPEARAQAVNRLFPPLPPLGDEPLPGPGPAGRP